MKVKSNQNGTVSILQMPRDLYFAICSILRSSERTFEWNDEEDEYWSNSDFLCSLSSKEKELLDKANWTIKSIILKR